MKEVKPVSPLTELAENDELIKIAELAAWWKVSKMTVYRMVHSGELDSVQIGRSLRVPRSAVNSYLETHGIPTQRGKN